jgi:cytochrome c-type biogenesis protein CcmF
VIAALGYLSILLATVSAIALVVQGWRVHRDPSLGRAALRLPVYGLVAGAVGAMFFLELALITHDFSIEYVARNNSTAMPLLFTIASAWAALEGSIVLWGLVLAGFTLWVFLRLQSTDRLGAGALGVMGLVALFWFGLMATAGNPFSTLPAAQVPAEGLGGNALLQNNILMAVHPPLLYLGFVGFTVPFAFAISALFGGERSTAWLDRTHHWSLISWSFLTVGIVLGGLWSYEVLGWGGYWAWDPVENASFVPWLVATAFIHSAVIQRRRGMLQAWNLALVISTFALTILGTFLTRSGVIASVHSFTQSAVGPALLAFLAVIIIGSFGLFAARAHLVASTPRLESLVSREGAFLTNNLLLTLFAFVVLVGTLYPILVEAFAGSQVSVGRPFFDRASTPIALALLLFMGLGPIMPYRVARPEVVWDRIRTPLTVALVVGAIAVVSGVRSPSVLLVFVTASFLIGVIARTLWMQTRRAAETAGQLPGTALRVMRKDPHYWGGQLSHVGVALLAVGIAVSAHFGDVTRAVDLDPGSTADFGGYTVTYVEPFQYDEGHRFVVGADVELRRGGDLVAALNPRLNYYPSQNTPVASPAVSAGISEDVYVSITRLDFDTAGISVDLYRFPFIWLVWFGGFLAAAGGAWALLVRKPRREVPVPAEVAARG